MSTYLLPSNWDAYEVAVDAIASCDGDLRGALRLSLS
jgi:hypothetical protein